MIIPALHSVQSTVSIVASSHWMVGGYHLPKIPATLQNLHRRVKSRRKQEGGGYLLSLLASSMTSTWWLAGVRLWAQKDWRHGKSPRLKLMESATKMESSPTMATRADSVLKTVHISCMMCSAPPAGFLNTVPVSHVLRFWEEFGGIIECNRNGQGGRGCAFVDSEDHICDPTKGAEKAPTGAFQLPGPAIGNRIAIPSK